MVYDIAGPTYIVTINMELVEELDGNAVIATLAKVHTIPIVSSELQCERSFGTSRT